MTGTTFEPDDERPGITVVDSIANRRFPIHTAEPLDPVAIGTDWCSFRIDAAVEFAAETLVLPYVVPTCVRDANGDPIVETEHYAYERLPPDEYLLELTAPIKLYLRVRSPVTIASADDRLELDFGDETRVELGAYSTHEQPAATVTTTAEPADLARAISTFGAALRTTDCERSLPSFRRHPPLLELGDGVRIPDGLESPDTGVTIVAPADRVAVYASCSLAYYLGARVRTGERPRIETDGGFEYELGRSPDAFAETVGRVLEHVFFLDTVVRTEGLYDVELHERRLFERAVERDPTLDLDPDLEALYEAPLAEQLRTYLSIPFALVADIAPAWMLETYVTADAANAPALPFLANDLSIVRTAPESATDRTAAPQPPADVDAFTRSFTRREGESGSGSGSESKSDDEASAEDSATANAAARPADDADDDTYVSLPDGDAFETAWLGPGIPVAANKLLPTAFEHKLERSPSSDAIEITLVCNDSRMLAEYDDEDGLYGNRDELPFDVTVRRNLSVAALREVLETDTDFLHYVGHVDGDAFRCRDGDLEARTLESVGVDTFLINGCRSYEGGVRLIEAGSAGGIVTLSEVGNRDATAVGRLLARLLNCGFTLRSAVRIAREHRFVGNQYVTVGDGSVAIVQSGGGVPNRCFVASRDDGRYELRQRTYHSQHGVGALYIPYLDDVDRYFLAGAELPPATVTGPELERFLQLEGVPVVFDGEFLWSTDDRLTGL